MSDLKRILIAGTGPVSIQVAVNLKNHDSNNIIGIVGRCSKNSNLFYNDLNIHNNVVEAHVQNLKHEKMQGHVQFETVYTDYKNIDKEWDAIVLTVTNDSYSEVLNNIPDKILKNVKSVILISSCVGSTSVVEGFFKSRNETKNIITLSTYYGDTKRDKKFDSSTKVLTKNVKEKIYIYSNDFSSSFYNEFCEMLEGININLEKLKNRYDVESKSISTYVHPSLLMNRISLEWIFDFSSNKKYIYKFFPEGPITQYVIRDMLTQFDEMRKIYSQLNVENFNFLKFVNDDNYPVKQACLSRDDIDNYETFDRVKQEYLLYVRYASILVDAYSEPDENGRYFDFSAVEMIKVYKDEENQWRIPRSPKEDFYRITLLKGMAKFYKFETPTIDKFIENYKNSMDEFKIKHDNELLSEDFLFNDFKSDISYITSTL